MLPQNRTDGRCTLSYENFLSISYYTTMINIPLLPIRSHSIMRNAGAYIRIPAISPLYKYRAYKFFSSSNLERSRNDKEHSEKIETAKKSLSTRIKEECIRYWQGSKQFAHETKLTFGLLKERRRGVSLSRREQLQIVRTKSDMIKLIPFSLFVIVPFLEFTLPFFLKFFPDMLPSTFEEKERAEMKVKNRDRVNFEMSKLLADSLIRSSYNRTATRDATIGAPPVQVNPYSELVQLLKQYQNSPQSAPLALLSAIKDKFPCESYAIKSLPLNELKGICKIMDLPSWHPRFLLMYRLSSKFEALAKDDLSIHNDSVNSLTMSELVNACQARGIQILGYSEVQLRSRLQKWIELGHHNNISTLNLLLLQSLLASNSS